MSLRIDGKLHIQLGLVQVRLVDILSDRIIEVRHHRLIEVCYGQSLNNGDIGGIVHIEIVGTLARDKRAVQLGRVGKVGLDRVQRILGLTLSFICHRRVSPHNGGFYVSKVKMLIICNKSVQNSALGGATR